MSRDTKIVAAFLSAIPVVILSASSICAWAISAGASMRWRVLFRLLCHGIERRCLTMFGVPMPICARCTGIYIGLFAGIVAFAVYPLLEERVLRFAMYAAALPMAIDGLTQAARLRESTNPLRLATGFAAAFVFGAWALSAIEQYHRPRAVNPS
ncbi:MAG TPA: DUF2085 domain-containing protein [Thermoanaerobaculia bacterium]|nr:DUF2085 domain-containing protein [Thermoanaerobaculia bacterium]